MSTHKRTLYAYSSSSFGGGYGAFARGAPGAWRLALRWCRIEDVNVLVLPTLGPLHLTQPRYNAVTLVELTRTYNPDAVLLASYSPEGLAEGWWRDEEELGLFHLLPWAERAGVPVQAVGERAEQLRKEGERFREYLAEMEKGQSYLDEEQVWQEELAEVLQGPLTPASWRDPRLAEALRRYLERVVERFGEGPATGFREARMREVADRIAALPPGRYVVWVDLLDFPVLQARLPEAQLPGDHTPSEEERRRAVLDRAWQLREEDDWGTLFEELREIGTPEAGYLAAQIYLAAGQVADAATLLQQVSEGDFHHPEYLPGYLLARLGQVRDLLGERERAIRAYRGVLALSWAPKEAREIAQAGLRTPFRVGET